MKKSIFKRIGLIALAVCVAIGSFFVPLKSDNDLNAAHADSVNNYYQYVSNDTYYLQVPIVDYINSSSLPALFSVSLINTPNGVRLFPRLYLASSSSDNSVSYDLLSYIGVQTLDMAWNNFYITSTNDGYIHSPDTPYRTYFSNSSVFSTDLYCTGSMFYQSGFNCNVYKIHIYLTHQNEFQYRDDYNFLKFDFYDMNDKYCSFSFLVTNDFYYSDRTYFLINTDELTENQIYNQGYQDGLADNQQNIYNNGYNSGYDIGFNQGRQDGIVEANDYSFTSLISSVVDVPVKTFLGLFTFDFLGVNLADFLLGLLTFCVIIFVIKLLLGGK